MKFRTEGQRQLFFIPMHLQNLMQINNVVIDVEKDYVLRIYDNLPHGKVASIKKTVRDTINQYFLLKALGFDDFSDYVTDNYYIKKLRQHKIFYTSCAGNWGRDKFESDKPRDLKGRLTAESYLTFDKKALETFKQGNFEYAFIFNDDENKFFFIKKSEINKLKEKIFEFSYFYDENDFMTLNQVLKGEIFK